jgi:O-antigen/teichoic acid export membrane protein
VAIAARRTPTVLSWRGVRQASRRFTWGLADQGMSTLTNFLLSVYVARTLGAVQFGAFSLAYVTYGFAIAASRGVSAEPLLIRFSGAVPPTWRRATAGSTGTALLMGLAAGTCALTAGLLVGGTTGLAFVALGLTLPGLVLQDSWRYAFFALGRGHHAFINDTVWAVVQIPLLVFLKMTGHANVFWFVLAWGIAATVGAAIGPLQAGVMPNLAGSARWLSQHRDLGPRYLAENTGGNASDTLRSYALSSILGLARLGYIQAVNVVMGPIKIIFTGIGLVTLPEAARLVRRSPRQLPLFCAAVAIGSALLALVWGVVLLVALPRGLGHLMLGSLWRPTYPLVLPATVALMASCIATGALIGMHAMGAARRSLRVVIAAAPIPFVFAIVGAVTGGTLGTMRFAAVGSWLGTLMYLWQFRKVLHESGTVPVPGWLWPRRSEEKPAPARRG